MISGAFKSKSLFNLLFLFITLLYRSLRSDVANLPPSKGTKGLNSGGITGTEVNIIHSGLLPEFINDSISFNLLIVLSSVTFDFISLMTLLSFFCSFLRSKFTKISLTASAPIPAVKASSPNSSWALSKASSDINCPFLMLLNQVRLQ